MSLLPFFLIGIVTVLYALRDELRLFVYPAYIPLIVGGALVLILLVIVAWVQKIHVKKHYFVKVSLLALTLLAVSVTPAPLSDATAQTRGVTQFIGSESTPIFRYALNTEAMELLDWLWLLGNDKQPERLEGSEMLVTGMVVTTPEGNMLVRYIIACCLADARPVGLPIYIPDSGTVESGTWYEVKGVLRYKNGSPSIEVIEAKDIPSPADPYVYR